MTKEGGSSSSRSNDDDDDNKAVSFFDFSSPLLLENDNDRDDDSTSSTSKEEYLIMLNSPTFTGGNVLETLWGRCSTLRICADGGANRLYNYDKRKIPEIICGDLDSIQEKIKSHYEAVGCQIVHAPDQDYNDLDKSIQQIPCSKNTNNDDDDNGQDDNTEVIHVYGALGGRLDQEMASFHALYKYHHLVIALYDEENVALLLPAHKHCTLNFPKGTVCGLIPLGNACESVSTKGLHWNLNEQKLEMG
eukprot:CAMPEP_0197826708 /NCGR_PEP_ID=MMETSP1437-20131217/3625_1 /TAXON_ID=49252 ORGANISM="Eucampia antarctica, Strain CCMP1452" /NCGR_SAMPLE_ID=MMETSP1437 /ASSEMBLY_ACC=CAM_ASM_001096 /LENGTH=247 /DNA_ID=CAMNT_0043427257 /DNA_START=144 /DNA_END=883 /DNA_ORIENTATION=-